MQEGRKRTEEEEGKGEERGSEWREIFVALEFEELTERIIGAAIEVHRELGAGFLESIYEMAFAIELGNRRIPFERQVLVPVLYRGQQVGCHRLDFFVADEIVVELKAIQEIEAVHFAVVRSYLRAVQRDHGLILNFARTTLEMRRVSARPLPPGPSPSSPSFPPFLL